MAGTGIAGLVMAGGQSRRMGRNKALLEFVPGGNLLALTYAKLAALLNPCYVSCANGHIYAPYPCIEDRLDNCGPAAGILAALEFVEARGFAGVLALACDMPFMEEKILRKLLWAYESCEPRPLAACYQSMQTGRIEMLAAIYGTAGIGSIKKALASGEKSLRKIVPHQKQLLIPYGKEQSYFFTNCNTLAEFNKARQQFSL